jgi:hypothetical protein
MEFNEFDHERFLAVFVKAFYALHLASSSSRHFPNAIPHSSTPFCLD